VGKAVDLGNMCDVDFVDALEHFEQDPQVRVVAVHMEGVRRGREFLQAAQRVARTKPVVVFKTGRSEAGARAALSHTGSLVGADEVADSAFRQHGLLRVSSMAELLAVCKAFLHLPPMAGPNLSVVTAAGASGIMAADACEDHGLQLAPFPEPLRGSLENERIAWHRLHNPVDIWPLSMVAGSFTRVFQTAAQGLMADPGTDAILGIAPMMRSDLHSDLDLEPSLREVLQSAAQPKPIALWLYGDGAWEQEHKLDAMPGVACFSSIDEAVAGLAATYRYTRLQRRAREE
jgi:acetyltransferase